MSLLLPSLHAQDTNADWSQIENKKLIEKTSRLETPANFELYHLNDYENVFQRLLAAPPRFNQSAGDQIEFELPMPDGSFSRFKVLSAPVMAPSLARKYPDIKNYTLVGITNPYAVAKIDFGPKGFHAMIMMPKVSTVFIDPYQLDEGVYMSYRKKDYPLPDELFNCLVEDEEFEADDYRRSVAGDCTFREYRLALACTGEYATYHGGTVILAKAAMNVTMNRVNGIFEKDAGITMMLVPNNDTLIFLNGGTDPYTNSSGSTMLNENQTTCDDYIGTANYDIGHVFSTGGGGIASLRSPCVASRKAKGVTGRGAPIGDPFDVDYVAHEMGHQYGGNHTQNNSCQRSSQSYEPGSASTIMGYAGICPPNVQNNSDPYYHAASLAEFASFVTNGTTGGSCDNVLSTANNPPTADAGANYTIPISTPFTLTGVGTDPDGDPITYCWEQYDPEVSTQPPSPTSTVGPNFRTLLPDTLPHRDFPKMGMSNTWEVLPSVGRTMDFRLTVRDYSSTYGYGCTEEDDMQVTTHAGAGPFALTLPNGGENWSSGGSDTVKWNVANSNLAPINCANVDILLSTDGGMTYPTSLATNVPNDGVHVVNVPNVTSTLASIKVKAVGNIFFDVSNGFFTIGADFTCVTYTSTDVPVTIPTTVSTVYSDLVISDTNSILSAEVSYVIGTHTWVGDLDFTLIHPSGAEVILVEGQCGNVDNFDMGFMDGAASVSCPLDQGLTYDPTGSLASLSTLAANGTWQLKIEDNVSQDGGSLTGWQIELCYADVNNCDDNLVFDSDTIPTGQYYANFNIMASVPLDAASTVLMQSQTQDFNPGFFVPLGAEFDAMNGGCP